MRRENECRKELWHVGLEIDVYRYKKITPKGFYSGLEHVDSWLRPSAPMHYDYAIALCEALAAPDNPLFPSDLPAGRVNGNKIPQAFAWIGGPSYIEDGWHYECQVTIMLEHTGISAMPNGELPSYYKIKDTYGVMER